MSLDLGVRGCGVLMGRAGTKPRTLRLAGILLLSCLAAEANAQSVIRSNFDHDSTGFRLDGAHIATGCGNCHGYRILSGTLRECEDCHAQGNTVEATAKPARHILASDRCEACHSTRSFIPLQRMDHHEVFGECIDCHNNQTAFGKPVDHPPAGDACENCHLTVSFSPVIGFDHSGITGNCVSCHNGAVAGGKPPDHLPTSDFCEDCHRTDTWSLVVTFDHAQALGTCSSCHNGVLATGQDADHLQTTAECDQCHSTAAWR